MENMSIDEVPDDDVTEVSVDEDSNMLIIDESVKAVMSKNETTNKSVRVFLYENLCFYHENEIFRATPVFCLEALPVQKTRKSRILGVSWPLNLSHNLESLFQMPLETEQWTMCRLSMIQPTWSMSQTT